MQGYFSICRRIGVVLLLCVVSVLLFAFMRAVAENLQPSCESFLSPGNSSYAVEIKKQLRRGGVLQICFLQWYLNKLGYRVAPQGTPETQTFTVGTREALKLFQRGRGLLPTGRFDYGTRESIVNRKHKLPAPRNFTMGVFPPTTENALPTSRAYWESITETDNEGNEVYADVDYYTLASHYDSDTCTASGFSTGQEEITTNTILINNITGDLSPSFIVHDTAIYKPRGFPAPQKISYQVWANVNGVRGYKTECKTVPIIREAGTDPPDIIPPIITLISADPPSFIINTSKAGTFTDDCTDTPPVQIPAGTIDFNFNTLSEGSHTCTITITDTSGNSGTFTLPTFTLDDTPPIITLNGENPITLIQGSTFTDPGATATENAIVTTSGTVNTAVPDTYTITYTATDTAGNTATETRQVVVAEIVSADNTPVILTPDPRTPVPLQDGTFHFWSNKDGIVIDAVASTCILKKPYTVVVGVNTIQFSPFSPGTYTCSIRVVDASGNTGSLTTPEFTITPNTPVILTPDPRTPVPLQDGTFHFWSNKDGIVINAFASTCMLKKPYPVFVGVNTIQFYPFSPGTYTCGIQVIDNASGNTGSLTTPIFTITTAPPKPANTSDTPLTITKAGLKSTQHNNKTQDTTPLLYMDIKYITPQNEIRFKTFNTIRSSSFTLSGSCATAGPVKIIKIGQPYGGGFVKDDTGNPVHIDGVKQMISGAETLFTTHNDLPSGTYTDCAITMTSKIYEQDVTSNTAILEPFTIVDPTFPDDPTGQRCLRDLDGRIIGPPKGKTLCEVEPDVSPTPSGLDYVTHSTKAGTPICKICTCEIQEGSWEWEVDSGKIYTFKLTPPPPSSPDDTHPTCKVSVRHNDGTISNTLTTPPLDIRPPVLQMLSFDHSPDDPSPTLSFSSSEKGVLSYSGSCIATHFAAEEGENTVIFIDLPDGTYNDCTISVTDQYYNTSQPLIIPSFTIAATTNTQLDAGEVVLILVHEDVYDDLQTHLATYTADIKREHGLIADIRKITEQQTILDTLAITRSVYQQGNLNGVLLVGDIPTGYFPLLSTHAIDDGIYLDHRQLCKEIPHQEEGEIFFDVNHESYVQVSSRDEIYGGYGHECYIDHNTTFPYWVARLSPNMHQHISSATHLQHYFERNHAFRTNTPLPADNPQYSFLTDEKISFSPRVLSYAPLYEFPEKVPQEAHDAVKQKKCTESSHPERMRNACFTDDPNDDFVLTDRYFSHSVPFLPELAKGYEFISYKGHGAPSHQQIKINVDALENQKPPPSFFLASFGSCAIARFTVKKYLVGAYLFGGKYGGGGLLVEAAPNVMFGNFAYEFDLYYPLRSGAPMYRTLTTVAPVWRKQTNIYGDPTLSMRYRRKESDTSNTVKVSLEGNEVVIVNEGDEPVPLYAILNKDISFDSKGGYYFEKHQPRTAHTVLDPGERHTARLHKSTNTVGAGWKLFVYFPSSENRNLRVFDLE